MKPIKDITDSEGTRYTINTQTREVIKSIDREGWVYDSEGNQTGENVHFN